MITATAISQLLRSIASNRHLLRLKPFETDSEQGRSMERYRRIALSGISGIAAKVMVALVGLASVPLTVHYLGKEQFGLWMAASSLIVWMQLTDLGVGNGLANALAEAHGRSDQSASREYVATALVATTLLALACTVMVFILADSIPWAKLLRLDSRSLEIAARSCFLAVGVLFAANVPLSISTRILVAEQNMHLSNIAQAMAAVLSLLALLLAIHLDLGLIPLVVCMSSASVLASIISWLFVLVAAPRKSATAPTRVTTSALRRIFKSSAPLFVFQIGGLLVNQSVNVVLAQLENLRIVADYNVVMKVYLLLFSIGLSITTPFYPAIREAYERGESMWIAQAIARTVLMRLVLTLPPALILMAIGDDLVLVWTNMKFEEEFGLLGWGAVTLSLLLAGTSSVLGDILTSLDRIWPQVAIVFLSAITVLAGMWILVPLYGVAGVFLAWAASTIYPIIWSQRKLKHTLDLSPR